MRTIQEITKEIKSSHEILAGAHEAIDDYYSGRNKCPMMGFGPIGQGRIINSCNKRLEEIKQELINEHGFADADADRLTREPPASGDVYEACMAFIKKMGAA